MDLRAEMNIYIAPPFGSYFRPPGAIPVLGSFTLNPRPGRTGQVLRTVRPVSGGWVNAVGLRNPGVAAIHWTDSDWKTCHSFAGVDEYDWEKLQVALYVLARPRYHVELNLSCPNVHEYGPPSIETLRSFKSLPNSVVSVKLPPDMNKAHELTDLCLRAGIQRIHLSNTLPFPVGGISGRALFYENIGIVQSVVNANEGRGLEVIAGGGIYTIDHARAYLDAGAKHLSLGTVFMNPIRGWRLYRKLREMTK